MRVFRKSIAVLLSVVMLIALCATAFATDSENIEIPDEDIELEVKDTQETADEAQNEDEEEAFDVLEEEIVDISEDEIIDEETSDSLVEDVVIEDNNDSEDVIIVEDNDDVIIDNDDVVVIEEDDETYSNEASIATYSVEQEEDEVQTLASKKQLDVIFVMGQSNAEGQINTGYTTARQQSIVCNNDIYSSVIPLNATIANNTTGCSFSTSATTSNVKNYIPESLSSTKSLNGNTLEYPLNWLSASGAGKSGPDSGIAYEWNSLTGDAVWVVNIAYGGSTIASWQSGYTGGHYEVALEAMKNIMDVYNKETSSSGDFSSGDVFMVWMQGESDCWSSTDWQVYTQRFMTMYNGFKQYIPLEACGFITVRATRSNAEGTGPLEEISARKAQLEMANNKSVTVSVNNTQYTYDTSDIYIASDANEDWVYNNNTADYFSYWYPTGINYQIHTSKTLSVPTTIADAYNGVHYNQVGHNENGITAARGMYKILRNGASTGSTKGTVNSTLGYPPSDDGSDVIQQSDGRWAYVKNGVIDTSYTGFACNTNGWWYINNGYVDFSKKGILHGTVGNIYGQWYVDGGKVLVDFYGVTNEAIDEVWWYIEKGMVNTSYVGVCEWSNDYGWWYVKDGYVSFDYTGLAKNSNGWWYCEDSKVNFNYTGLVPGTVNGVYGTWYVSGGKVQTTYSGPYYDADNGGSWYISNGLAYHDMASFTTDEYGNDTIYKTDGSVVRPVGITYSKVDGNYYYYVNGVVDTTVTTVAETTVIDGTDSWYYVENGKVNLSYTGLAENQYGWWYLENGKVNFNYNGIVPNEYWSDGWYVVGGQVQFGYTGVANYASSDNVWYYINAGKVDKTKNSVEMNDYGWWYVLNGVVQFNYTGVANYANDYGWWYINGGKVDFSYYGVAYNTYGTWYVEGGQVTFTFTGLSNYADENGDWWYFTKSALDTSVNDIVENIYGWWYVENGKVNFNITTVAQNQYGWWYVVGGQVNFEYTGLASNTNGWWKIENGKVDFSYEGFAHADDDPYIDSEKKEYRWGYCFEGKVDFTYTDIVEDKNCVVNGSSGVWGYVVNGWVDESYTDVSAFANDYGWWYIRNGFVDFTYTGLALNGYGWWYIANGKVDFSYEGFACNWSAGTWWYCENGQPDFTMNSVIRDPNGVVKDVGTDTWWYVVGGEVQFNYTGVANYPNEYGSGWWYIKNGYVDFSYTGWASNDYGTWYVVEGQVDFSYTS